jgi:glycosyltransferase involved in cell wall biosynthesis
MVRAALYGNIANNAFNMTNILLGQGIEAKLIDDGIDTFTLSRPFWEEVRLAMPYEELMAANQTPDFWRSIESQHNWHSRNRVVYPKSNTLRLADRLKNKIRKLTAAIRPHNLNSQDLFQDSELVNSIRISQKDTIDCLKKYDVIIAFGFVPLVCAFLADKPTIYFTYGGDMRVQLANRNDETKEISKIIKTVLASDKIAIEAYGCDKEINEILRNNNLIHKSTYAYLPNINLPLFSRKWNKNPARKTLGWDETKFIFFMASRIDYKWKSSDLFIKTFAKFAQDKNDVLLVVTGWGRDYLDAKQILEDANISDKVIFLKEAYSKPILFDMYAASDVVVDQFQIGSLGSVSYEALCMGKPVLTYLSPFATMSYCYPPPIINACTEKDIYEKLEFCYSNPNKLKIIGDESADWYKKVYNPANLSDSVKILADNSPKKWIASANFNQQGLPNCAVHIPNLDSSIEILPWPYPYSAGITIANDCEYYCWDDFCQTHRWLNNELQLPISDSFWFYSEDPENLGFSYFQGTDFNKISPYAPHIEDLIKLGFLDTLHTYGGFDLNGSFKRIHAEKAIDILHKVGGKIKIWTNHGNSNNTQNIGGLFAGAYQKGDVPSSQQYHTDILLNAGVRYFWLDSYSTNRLSLGNEKGRGFINDLAADDASIGGDQILCRDFFRDSNIATVFRRFRGARKLAPDPDSLSRQLSNDNLDHIEKTGGALILYQHFGCKRNNEGQPSSRRGLPFPDAGRQQLQELAQRYQDKKIWVTTTANMLGYLDTISQLRFDIETTENGFFLNIFGHRKNISVKDLSGIHIKIKGRAKILGIRIRNDKTAMPCRYDIKETGEDIRYIFWPHTTLPEFPF